MGPSTTLNRQKKFPIHWLTTRPRNTWRAIVVHDVVITGWFSTSIKRGRGTMIMKLYEKSVDFLFLLMLSVFTVQVKLIKAKVHRQPFPFTVNVQMSTEHNKKTRLVTLSICAIEVLSMGIKFWMESFTFIDLWCRAICKRWLIDWSDELGWSSVIREKRDKANHVHVFVNHFSQSLSNSFLS